MKIIATTPEGFLIEATKQEVQEIAKAISGVTPEKLEPGFKLPAYDYASTIRQAGSLSTAYEFNEVVNSVERFSRSFEKLKTAIEQAKNLTQ